MIDMRRAFTLMELMVVVGIMAFLGIAATNGYNALQRGMAERGAVDAASALLKAAKERAMVDRVPTAVFCYNRMIREASADENAVVAGEAVAIRRYGRITRVENKYLYDEFGDLETSYDRLTSESDFSNRKGMRLWRFDDKPMNQMQYSIVADAVFDDYEQPGNGTGVSFMPWGDQLGGGSQASSNIEIRACAFRRLDKSSDHEPSSWQVGNGYGFEFQTIRLPEGFIFKNAIPDKVGSVAMADAFLFDPANYSASASIDIYACRPDVTGKVTAHHKAGTATSVEGGAK